MSQQKYNKTVQVQVTIIPRQPGKELSVKEVPCNKSFRKDEPLTSLTLFFNIFIIKIRFSLSNVLIRGEANLDDTYVEKSVHLSKMTSYKIHTLGPSFLGFYLIFDAFLIHLSLENK